MIQKKYFIPFVILLVILAIDQFTKIYIKTHFYLGEEVDVVGNWFKLHFTENYGMAFGLEFGGRSGKIALTIFRLAFIGGITWHVISLIKQQASGFYVICWVLIIAGALGNVIDSVLYGKLFSESYVYFNKAVFMPLDGGYADWFHGRVVDMFYFPLYRAIIPDWSPIWAGEDFEFFRPVFNVADASISVGFVLILLFQKRFFKEESLRNAKEEKPAITEDDKSL